MKILRFSRFWFLLFLFPTASYADFSQEEVIDEFIRIQKEGSLSTPNKNPAYNTKYYLPLNKVIPVEMQKRLRERRNNKRPLSFGNVSRSVDLRYRDTPVTTQVGSRCSAYGLIASMENLLGRPEVNKLSESHLWSSYRAYSSASAVEAAKRMAITEYKSWPSNRRNPYSGWKEKTHTALEHISYIEDDVVEAVEALDAGRPVYIGMSVTYSMAKCNTVMDPNSGNNGGGHAVTISGYTLDERVLGGGYFIIKNSWGEDCGDKGYLYMPFHYCLRGGKSYCIMWDLEGIKTAFPDVPNVTPKIPEFSMKKINISLHSYKKWYQRSRTVTMGVEGRSLHVRQIKDITYSIDGAEFSKPVLNKLDKMTFSFKTKSSSHNIALKINLKDGSEVVSTHEWRLK